MNAGHSKCRFLFALELGGNFGHLVRCLPIARTLQAQGHMVLFAVPDSRTAAQILAPHQLAFVEAPHITVKARTPRPPVNYADMLLREGYRDTVALQGAVQAWLKFFQLFKADVIIADHAPTALLAARVAHVRPIAIGSGFEIPPQSTPLPSMRPWDDVTATELIAADEHLLTSLNMVLIAHRQPPMTSVTELFGATTRILATFPELDHYGARPGEYYAGVFYELAADEHTPVVTWPSGEGAKLLVYMRPAMPSFAPLLKALKASNHRVIFAAPGTHPSHVARFSAPNLHFSHQAIAFEPLLAEADLAIGYGSIGFTTQALRAGLPQLIAPTFIEQQLCGRRVMEIDAGFSLSDDGDDARYLEASNKILSDSNFTKAAAVFSGNYRNYVGDLQKIVELLLSQTSVIATDLEKENKI